MLFKIRIDADRDEVIVSLVIFQLLDHILIIPDLLLQVNLGTRGQAPRYLSQQCFVLRVEDRKLKSY
jgi:hypothetical protein